jgi:hypothetical protein
MHDWRVLIVSQNMVAEREKRDQTFFMRPLALL